MGRKAIDLVGQKFGRLTVIERAENDKDGKAQWLCLCDCGNTTVKRGYLLRSKEALSCGCLVKELARQLSFVHGLHHTRLYSIWHSMKSRCLNPAAANYSNYGGRGITICDEWRRFEPFYDWAMANGYQEDLSIDRINPNGNYEPSNCRFADSKTQANNRRNNRFITYKGESKTIAEWERKMGLPKDRLLFRLSAGWSIERALTTPVDKSKSHPKK